MKSRVSRGFTLIELIVVDDGGIRLLDVTGFSVESNERIVDELEVVIDGTTEAIAIWSSSAPLPGVPKHLLVEAMVC